ncbi:hypothetical protein ACHAXS_007001 [Conticribra weissflogii]
MGVRTSGRKVYDVSFEGYDPQTKSSKISRRITELFLPDSYVRIAWDVFIFFVIWYNAIMTPIRIFIMSGKRTPEALVSLDVLFDFIFVADTIIRFFRPYIDENSGEIVMDQRMIAIQYRGSFTFFINLIACIPILKLPLHPILNPNQLDVMNTYFNVLRMIRVLHLPDQFQELKRFRERKAPVNEPVFRMYVILFFMLLFMCECGCLYFGLSTLLVVEDICPRPENFVDDILGEELWVASDSVITSVMDTRVCEADPEIECDDCPQIFFFVRSIYFLMQTIFTIGYGDSVVPSKSPVEMTLACAFMFCGVFGYAMTIANMTSVLSNLDVVNMQFRHEMDSISHWLSLRSVPNSLRQRLSMYFSYLSRSQHGMMDEILLNELPHQLRIELADINRDFIGIVPFFLKERRDEYFLSQMSTALNRRVYTPGTFMLHEGAMQRELHIVKSGRADIIISGAPDVVGSLLAGDYIGDYQLLFGTTNQVSIRTSEFSEVLVLTFENFKKAMDHPHNRHFSFASLGYTFHKSNDEGCLDTIKTTNERLQKIWQMADTLLSGKSRSKLKNMMDENIPIKNEFTILPNSKIHLYWDAIAIVAIMYYLIGTPIRITLYIRSDTLESSYDYTFYLDYIFDILFIIDMILRATIYSFAVYENGQRVVISDRTQIRQKYLSSKKFRVDCIAVFPFDLIPLGTGRNYALFRLLKMIRVTQVPQVMSTLQEHLEASTNLKMNETQKSILMMLIFSFFLIIWSSCGWNSLRPGEHWIISIYWALTTLSTVGYGDVTPTNFNETCYALFVGAIGAVFTAAVVANVTSFFHATELSESNNEHKLNCIKRFMDRHKTPHDLAHNVSEYFDYIEQEQEGMDEGALLSAALPDHLSTNLLVHITRPMVCECEFFADCESGFIRRIMTSLEQEFYIPLYMIMTKDVVTRSMYFIKRGKVELMTQKPDQSLHVVHRLDANASFAEGCLTENWKSNPFIARTASECEIWRLRKSVFLEIIQYFPRSRSLVGSKKTTKKDERGRRTSMRNILKATEKAGIQSRFFIHPHSHFIQGWFGLVLTVTLYSILAIPFRVSFLENHDISTLWLAIDYFGDIIFLADFFFRVALVGFYDENNNLVANHRDIWARYVNSGKMKWHVLSMLPIEGVVFFYPSLCPLWKLQMWSLFRMNKLLRAIEMPHLTRQVEYSLARSGIKVPKNPLKVLKLLLVILMLAHINSCVFFAMANFNQHNNRQDPEGQVNWANSQGLLESSPTCPGNPASFQVVSHQYTAALYWAMATISTVGYGDITAHLSSTPEILYSTLILLVGMSVYTLVIASLEDIVAQLDVTSSLYKMKTDKISAYSQLQCLPDSLKAKINSYYEQLWRSHLGIKGDKLMNYIPSYFKEDLIGDMTKPYVEKTFFIKNCGADFIAQIVQSLDLEVYLRDDFLFRQGERCDILHYVYSGSIDLLTAQNVKFKTVSHCALGESSFFLFEPHFCTAKAADTCELFQLSMDSFVDILKDHHLSSKFQDHIALHHKTLLEAKSSLEKTILNLNSSKMVRFLDANEGEITVPKGVLLPESRFRVVWDIFAMFGVLYLIFSIPTKISFATASISLSSVCIDVWVDVYFMADIYCRCNKFAIVKDGFLISSPNDFGKIYREQELQFDLLSAIPVSAVAFFFGVGSREYGFLRLLQALRAIRFGKYVDDLVDYVNTRTYFVISTATLRVCQILLIILVLCHWFGCTFHLIGSIQEASENWISVDGMQDEQLPMRYLRSFYWALYTMTTIGYGSVPVMSIPERVFAMIAMAVGAVICDAGLTAVLAAIIENKDHQAGSNNRRIQCSKLFMKTNNIDQNLQDRILDYYVYADVEMRNIDESSIINDLSSSLRSEILHHFCFEPLRQCTYFDDYSDGAIVSLVRNMVPYIAVPGEHLSEIGKTCHSMYVFQKGNIQVRDAAGFKSNLPEGSIIGHLASSAASKKEGLWTHGLKLELLSANLPKSKSGNPYVIIKNGISRCKSMVQNSKYWMEMIEMKVKAGNGKFHKVEIVVNEWSKRQSHTLIGTGEVLASETSSGKTEICSIFDDKGKTVGSIQLRATLWTLSEAESNVSHELTVTSLVFSNLYRLNISDDELLREYLHRSTYSNIADRIPSRVNEVTESSMESGCANQAQHAGRLEKDSDVSGSPENENNWNRPYISKSASIPSALNGRRKSVFFVDWADQQP